MIWPSQGAALRRRRERLQIAIGPRHCVSIIGLITRRETTSACSFRSRMGADVEPRLSTSETGRPPTMQSTEDRFARRRHTQDDVDSIASSAFLSRLLQSVGAQLVRRCEWEHRGRDPDRRARPQTNHTRARTTTSWRLAIDPGRPRESSAPGVHAPASARRLPSLERAGEPIARDPRFVEKPRGRVGAGSETRSSPTRARPWPGPTRSGNVTRQTSRHQIGARCAAPTGP